MTSRYNQPQQRQTRRVKNKPVEQLELLYAPIVRPPVDPLHGLAVQLPDTCSCGSRASIIGAGRGRHSASLFCSRCGSYRGLVPLQIHAFLSEIVNKFGRPAAPIEIRRGEQTIRNSDQPECAPTASSVLATS
jgi:hypothetical protein